MGDYDAFLRGKAPVVAAAGFEAGFINEQLFAFQRDVVRWALAQGRAAAWLDCGLGKGPIALTWAHHVAEHTGRPVLILAPLAVSQQLAREAVKFAVPGVEASKRPTGARIQVTNYQSLQHFDARDYGGVVLDESSILKDHSARTRGELIEAFARTPFRLCCTATPAPNDVMELANHAEFLGVMKRAEMLAMYFTHDGGETQKWRLKRHGERSFWEWVSGWAVAMRRPSDLGYDDGKFALPELVMHEHTVAIDQEHYRAAGNLFAVDAATLTDQRAARRMSVDARVAKCAELVNGSSDSWLVWCELNRESEALAKAIRGAVAVSGSDDDEVKEARMLGFADHAHRVLISKPSICGHGMNWQHCANVAFVGAGHSFEQWYQAVRRVYRFGQARPVQCHMIASDADGRIVANLARKQREAESMTETMVQCTKTRHMKRAAQSRPGYDPRQPMRLPSWLRSEA